MTRAVIMTALGISLMAGCATLRPGHQSVNDVRFNAGVKALSAGDYPTAERELAWVVEHAADDPVGQRALLIYAATQMDPRNPARKTEAGSQLAARFLRLPERDAWVDPVAQTLYLMGLELGEAEDRAERAEQKSQARELPKLPGPTVTARIKAVEQERDRLARRVSTLEDQLSQSQRELERIKKTIKN